MFVSARYDIKAFDRMYPQCPHCKLSFELEPGYYTGAMYVSYAFSVAIFIIVGFTLYLLFNDPPIYVYVLTTFLTILLLFPVVFRYSRVIYLHFFGGIKYQEKFNGSTVDEKKRGIV